jgi:hypothetical protein
MSRSNILTMQYSRVSKRLGCLCVCFICVSVIKAQGFDTLLNYYNKQVPQEKAYVHFDNTTYAPGETVWYKAYLLIGADISWLSKTFYIDWFDEEGKLINRTIAPVLSASATGSFTIPEGIKGNSICALAYTKWMLNFDSAFLFHKTLLLLQKNAVQKTTLVNGPPTLAFFPEGGDMVENIAGNVAFKATRADGMPIEIEGALKDKTGKPIGSFRSRHDGMGRFRFTPLPSEQYTAEWKDVYGNSYQTILPVAKQKGIVLSINNISGARQFSIERNEVLEDRFQRVTVVAHMNQQVVFRAAAGFTGKTKVTSTLPVKDLPSGILQFTVFDALQQPVAERILFVNNNEYQAKAEVYTDTLNTSKRAKNVYEIEIPDSALASLSLAVTSGESFNDPSSNIISQLLLSGEIKGYVHDPAYYFSSIDDTVASHLDLVMLTNGWRRFVWKDVLAGNLPTLKYKPDTTYLTVAGKIKMSKEKKDIVNLLVVAKDSTEQLMYMPLKPDGSFEANDIILFDTARIYYGLEGKSMRSTQPLTIGNLFLPLDRKRQLYYPWSATDTSLSARMKNIGEQQKKLEALMNQATLQEVTVRTTRPKTRMDELNERYASPQFNTVDALQINVVDDKMATTNLSIYTYLRGKVPGLTVYAAYSQIPVVMWRGERVMFLLNERKVDPFFINSLSMTDVAYIKAFRNGFFGYSAGDGAGNVVAIYTKRGADEKPETLGPNYTLLPGYTPVKEFYSPDYSEPKPVAMADLRHTILWNPYIQAGGNNRKIKVSFYNNDISQSFRVVLEGITQDGRMIHINKILK